ncbi:glucosamine kinase [Catenulispora sp. EB89]|uniref:N-acetylglucosamine kinase n=1 Tax=Catenulispora sp. EB89 TaxID=3156257 RepID=UPI003519A350
MAASMADRCVVGLDVGGSHSRAVLATVDGRTLGTGRAGGGNPTVLGAGAAIANIVAALRAALGDVPGERVEACVVGLAGVSTLLADPKAPHVLAQAWADAGLTCAVRVVSDVTVAFAAGTAAPDGTLLVSGTGAVAARMRDRLPVQFRDGYGWLLGDEGSGFWIGRQAARAALAAADGRRPMAELATSVLARLIDGEHGDRNDHDGPASGTPGGAVDAVDLATSTTASRSSSPDSRASATGSLSVGAPAPAALAAANKLAAPAGATTANTATAAAAAAPATTAAAAAAAAPATTAATTPPNPPAAHPSAPVRPPATAPLPLAASIGEGFTRHGRRRAAELVRAVTAQPTVALARLAPLVMAAYELGDPAAVRIVAQAAEALVDSLAGVRPAPGEPVVLGGSVLVSRSPVFDAVAAAIGRRWPDSPVALAADGAAGATWLAARQVVGAGAAAAGHAAFVRADNQFAEFS